MLSDNINRQHVTVHTAEKYGYRRKTAPFKDVMDPDELEDMLGRFGKSTTASSAARHDFDTQKSHIDYLSKTRK